MGPEQGRGCQTSRFDVGRNIIISFPDSDGDDDIGLSISLAYQWASRYPRFIIVLYRHSYVSLTEIHLYS